ncbi:related to CAP1 - F-actin capping protein alpha subunit [Ustilago trichophora]|uniref:Related to CAP1 - F-actin capping protein alpha subunit n=1 Tax=Ustilago trichophora TaxID=86804 RepID=A0A5C3DS77_9BASI|nr:related to CAP1 - F-actin capping protein alpha subunit [Ustilago trichophora]
MSNSARLTEALTLLTQSPPGQTSQVYHDLRGILFDAESNASDRIDDAALQSAAALALEEYNMQQLVTATLPNADGKDVPVIICQASQIPDASADTGVKRYTHPKLHRTFLYDHVKRSVSDVKDAKDAHEDVEKVRSALEKAVEEYVRDRYPDGVSSVFAVSSVPVKELEEVMEKAQVEDANTPSENTAAATGEADATEASQDAEPKTDAEKENKVEDDPVEAAAAAEAVASSTSDLTTTSTAPPKTTYTLHHVGNRFNLSNFWSGRWRASYTLDPSTLTLTSSLSVQVHYFENGNVQLNASKPRTFQLSSNLDEAKPDELAKEVVNVIASHEDAWQKGLEESYDELAERAFKALRRQLPLTRQKVDWDKVLNYKLGDELSRA